MHDRKISSMLAAGFVALALGATATTVRAEPLSAKDVIVEGKRIDPSLQRTISYADLDLARFDHRQKLDTRIFRTARILCFDLNDGFQETCTREAVQSTKEQRAAAVARAQRQWAGLPAGPMVAIAMVVGR